MTRNRLCTNTPLFLVQFLLLAISAKAWLVPQASRASRSSALQATRTTFETAAVDDSYYSTPPTQPQLSVNAKPRVTLTRFLGNIVKEDPGARDMESLLLSIQMACKTISNLVNRAGLANDLGEQQNSRDYSDGRFYSMKRLDLLSTIVLKNALQFTGKCKCVAPGPKVDTESPAEHQPGVLIASALDSNYVTVLDPLDGSGNADASICTATVFGVFEQPPDSDDDDNKGAATEHKTGTDDPDKLVQSVLQPAKNMRAAGYCLYSSATVLVFTLQDGGVFGFTLDPQLQEFVLTHRDLTIPKRGNVYSCNEANSEGWDEDWKSYVKNLKLGQGETKKPYALRYVGSMVGDIHRTLLYGGIFAYPSDRLRHPDGNLQLLYKTAPMAFVVHRAGGKVIDGRTGSLLDLTPERVHQKSPCFMGSPEDVEEFEKYLKN